MHPSPAPARPFPFPSRSSAARRACAALAAVSFTATLACSALAGGESQSTRRTMHRVFQALIEIMPAAASVSDWERADVQAPVAALADAAQELAAHGQTRDASFRFLSQSLASDARMIQRQLALRRYEGASYFTERVAETCIACHVRLPAQPPAQFTATLLAGVDQATLSSFARAGLQTASRQFAAALDTYEAAFADRVGPVDAGVFSSSINAYLIVALRVQRDPARARRGLELLGQRRDLASQLQHNLGIWQRALTDLEPALREPPSLERAQQILDAGRALSDFPLDNADRVHTIVASSVLFRHLEQNKPEGPALAQALYQLARTEAFTRRAFDVSEADAYLEQAIHAAPHTEIAERAYGALEAHTIRQYQAEAGGIPPEVYAWLLQLRDLSDVAPREEPREPERRPLPPGIVRLDAKDSMVRAASPEVRSAALAGPHTAVSPARFPSSGENQSEEIWRLSSSGSRS